MYLDKYLKSKSKDMGKVKDAAGIYWEYLRAGWQRFTTQTKKVISKNDRLVENLGELHEY